MKPEKILIDGVEAESICVLDRGLQFGDGLFETIACPEGHPRLLPLHLDRLTAGCARLGIAAVDRTGCVAEIVDLARGSADVIVKLIVTRGVALARGYAPAGTEQPTRILLRYGWPPEDPQHRRKGVRVGLASVPLGENPVLCGLKHLNRLEQVLAQAELRRRNLQELLMFSSSGRLISGTMSNVFIVQGQSILTPRLDRAGVAGVMRRALMEAARPAGMAIAEAELGAADLEVATEIFLTNARIGIWPVSQLEARQLAPGPVTRTLLQLLAHLLEGRANA